MNFTEANPRNHFSDRLSTELTSLLGRISHLFASWDVESYVVGGLVRDLLLGRDTIDIDIAVASNALEIAPLVAESLGGKYVLLDSENKIGRVILFKNGASSSETRWILDFSTIEINIEQDLARRDFTINAMAVNLGHLVRDADTAQVIDPFNGIGDLELGVIRAVSDTIFSLDAVRLLRAIRLAAELNFSIDKETESLIQQQAHLIKSVAGERIREELLRLLGVSGTGQYLLKFDKLGLLTAVFPELTGTKGVVQPKEHHWDVFDHSVKTVQAVDFLLRQGDWSYIDGDILTIIPWSEKLAEHFDEEISGGSNRRVLLKLAALLHDVAKPQTKKIEANGRMRFLGHAQEGAIITAEILQGLTFSNREIKLVEAAVKHHLRPGQMSQEGMPTRRAIYRYFRDTGEDGIDILFLNLADHLATRGPDLNLNNWREHAEMTAYVLSRHLEGDSIIHLPKLVDGHDLIDVFGMTPGPEVGEILEAVNEAQAVGEFNTREEALAFIQKLVN